MATAAITQGGKETRDRLWNGSWLYRTRSTETIRTVGYTSASSAKSAAQAAAGENVEARWGRDGQFYYVEVDTFTLGDWTAE